MACSCTKPIFLCQCHVSGHGHVSVSRPCFNINQIHVIVQGHVSIQSFFYHFIVYSLFLGVQMVLCIIISIHSKDIHPKITSSFCKFLCFMYYIFNMCHIFIGYISFMYYIHGFFLIVFFSFFFVDWLANTWGEALSSENVKSVTSITDLPKPRLHAFLSP